MRGRRHLCSRSVTPESASRGGHGARASSLSMTSTPYKGVRRGEREREIDGGQGLQQRVRLRRPLPWRQRLQVIPAVPSLNPISSSLLGMHVVGSNSVLLFPSSLLLWRNGVQVLDWRRWGSAAYPVHVRRPLQLQPVRVRRGHRGGQGLVHLPA